MKNLFRIAIASLVLGISFIPASTFAASAPRLHFSNNWAGYAATGDRYSAVTASWTVSSSTATDQRLSADATWVGIGGVSSGDLIQAGTQVVIQNGVAHYSAWYELLPDTQQTSPVAVHPGDRMTVSIKEKSTNFWSITIANLTTGVTSVTTTPYASSHSSAEWIVERPLAVSDAATGYLPLSNYGTVQFQNASTTNMNGVAMTPASSGAEPLIMGDVNARIFAAPQDIKNGGFAVSYLSDTGSQQYLNSLRNSYTFTQPAAPAARVSQPQLDTQLIIRIIFSRTHARTLANFGLRSR